MISYEKIIKSDVIRTYITSADESLAALGFTEHSFTHVLHVAETAGYILKTIGYDDKTVEYSVIESVLEINESKTEIQLSLRLDKEYGSIMDFFEIFMERMLMCRRAAEKLGLQFKLRIDGQQLI